MSYSYLSAKHTGENEEKMEGRGKVVQVRQNGWERSGDSGGEADTKRTASQFLAELPAWLKGQLPTDRGNPRMRGEKRRDRHGGTSPDE